MPKITGQPQCLWWDENHPDQAPSVEARKLFCDWTNNPANPFHNFVGNQHALRRLNRAAFAILGRFNHECHDFSFALVGPPSTGKATLARRFCDSLFLPFVELPPNCCQSMTDVASRIAEVCETFDCGDGGTLELVELAGHSYTVPPLIVFIDEFQALGKKIELGLAKAIHGNFTTENGFSFDSSHICWIVSTTTSDLLVDPFENFPPIHLKPLNAKEVAQVVAIHNPDWEADVCQIVAQYAGSPGEALAFAKEMRLEFEMNGGEWKEVAETVAKDWDEQKSTPWLNRLKRNRRN